MVESTRIREKLTTPNWERLFYIRYALQSGMSVDAIAEMTHIDPWFLRQIEELVEIEGRLRSFTLGSLPDTLLRRAKRCGFSDRQLGHLMGCTEQDVRELRQARDLHPVFKRVDTCAAEFAAETPYATTASRRSCVRSA